MVFGPKGPAAMMVAMVAGPVIVVVALVLVTPRTGSLRKGARHLGLRFDVGLDSLQATALPAFAGVVGLVALVLVQGPLLRYVGVDPEQIGEQQLVTTLRETASPLLIYGISFVAIVVAPVTEEVLFRGVIYLPLRSKLGRVGAAVLVSLVFAGVHEYAGPWAYAFHVVYLGFFALVLTALLETSGTLVIPILAHALHNGLNVLLVLSTRGAAG
jgi:hypothetical protein